MIGGPTSNDHFLLTVRWLGTTNFELTYRGQAILLSACFDPRGKGQRGIGVTADQVVRADAMFFGHDHFDHTRDGAVIGIETRARVFGNEKTIVQFRGQGVPENLLNVVDSGDVYHFTGFTVQPFRMLHSSVGNLTESYWGHTPEFWATAYGAIADWGSGLLKQLQALEDNQPPPAGKCPPPPTMACPSLPPVPATTTPLPGAIAKVGSESTASEDRRPRPGAIVKVGSESTASEDRRSLPGAIVKVGSESTASEDRRSTLTLP